MEDTSMGYASSSHENNQRLMSVEIKKSHVQDTCTQTEPPARESIESSNKDHRDQGTQKHNEKQTEKVASTDGAWPKLLCYYSECDLDHLPRDCPSRPIPREPPKRTSFNMIETIPGSSETEFTSLNVVTRAHAKQQGSKDPNTLETKNKPKKRKRRKA